MPIKIVEARFLTLLTNQKCYRECAPVAAVSSTLITNAVSTFGIADATTQIWLWSRFGSEFLKSYTHRVQFCVRCKCGAVLLIHNQFVHRDTSIRYIYVNSLFMPRCPAKHSSPLLSAATVPSEILIIQIHPCFP